MAATKTKKPKAPPTEYRTMRFSHIIGKNKCKRIVVFLHVRINPKTESIHMSHGFRYNKATISAKTRFTKGKWKSDIQTGDES